MLSASFTFHRSFCPLQIVSAAMQSFSVLFQPFLSRPCRSTQEVPSTCTFPERHKAASGDGRPRVVRVFGAEAPQTRAASASVQHPQPSRGRCRPGTLQEKDEEQTERSALKRPRTGTGTPEYPGKLPAPRRPEPSRPALGPSGLAAAASALPAGGRCRGVGRGAAGPARSGPAQAWRRRHPPR